MPTRMVNCSPFHQKEPTEGSSRSALSLRRSQRKGLTNDSSLGSSQGLRAIPISWLKTSCSTETRLASDKNHDGWTKNQVAFRTFSTRSPGFYWPRYFPSHGRRLSKSRKRFTTEEIGSSTLQPSKWGLVTTCHCRSSVGGGELPPKPVANPSFWANPLHGTRLPTVRSAKNHVGLSCASYGGSLLLDDADNVLRPANSLDLSRA